MIAFLRGKPVSNGVEYVIIDVGGIGYKVFVPSSAVGALTDDRVEVVIHTYLHVREDAMLLYGFQTESDREIFEQLIQVSGIGPKVALAMLSSMEAGTIVQAVINEQVDILVQIPGVGKKTAQRVIIELKDKLSKMDIGPAISETKNFVPLADISGDVISALTALGYSAAEAKKALGKISLDDCKTLKPGELVRLVLKELGRF